MPWSSGCLRKDPAPCLPLHSQPHLLQCLEDDYDLTAIAIRHSKKPKTLQLSFPPQTFHQYSSVYSPTWPPLHLCPIPELSHWALRGSKSVIANLPLPLKSFSVNSVITFCADTPGNPVSPQSHFDL